MNAVITTTATTITTRLQKISIYYTCLTVAINTTATSIITTAIITMAVIIIFITYSRNTAKITY